MLESGRDRKWQRENNERYASPCFQRKSDEKMLRLASVSVDRDRVNSEKNASSRSERKRASEGGRTTRGMPRLVLNGKRREDSSPRFR